jgi:hypothetical protein
MLVRIHLGLPYTLLLDGVSAPPHTTPLTPATLTRISG